MQRLQSFRHAVVYLGFWSVLVAGRGRNPRNPRVSGCRPPPHVPRDREPRIYRSADGDRPSDADGKWRRRSSVWSYRRRPGLTLGRRSPCSQPRRRRLQRCLPALICLSATGTGRPSVCCKSVFLLLPTPPLHMLAERKIHAPRRPRNGRPVPDTETCDPLASHNDRTRPPRSQAFARKPTARRTAAPRWTTEALIPTREKDHPSRLRRYRQHQRVVLRWVEPPFGGLV
jgi:hypothetical protein